MQLKFYGVYVCFGLSISWASADDNVFDFDAPTKAHYALADGVWFGSEVSGNMQYVDNLNLDDAEDDHLWILEPEVSLVFSYAPHENFGAYIELEITDRSAISRGQQNNDATQTRLRLRQAYIAFPKVFKHVSLAIGRQRYKDVRAWWYDERIDAARLVWSADAWSVALSSAVDKVRGDDLLHKGGSKNNHFKILNVRYQARKHLEHNFYLIKKNDHEKRDKENPLFFGVQSAGRVTPDLHYWLNAAAVRGTAKGTRIEAYGLDLGFGYRFNLPTKPFLMVGVAYGSGDDQANDRRDRNFRQTGLEDNDGRLFGYNTYNYYGEVIDVGLSNLWITTLGVGFTPTKNTSIEWVYHTYQQVHRQDELFDSDLDQDPNGQDRDIGQALDLVMAYRASKQLNFGLILGVFKPGQGFDGNPGNAYIGKFESSYRF